MRAIIVIPKTNLYSLHRACRKAHADYLCGLPPEEFDRVVKSISIGADIVVGRISSGAYNYLLTPTDRFLWYNILLKSKIIIAKDAIQS
jgi:hypothetical protein